jgi:hypothetical protein
MFTSDFAMAAASGWLVARSVYVCVPVSGGRSSIVFSLARSPAAAQTRPTGSRQRPTHHEPVYVCVWGRRRRG